MKALNIIFLLLIAVLLLVPAVSAVDQFIYGERSVTMKQMFLVSLGIEKLPGMVLAKAIFYYNWISMGFLFLIGAMSSKRMTRFFALLVPIFAAILVFLGWLQSPNPIATYSIIIMCGILGAASYMKGSLRENFGGGGPGSLLINIVFYLLILQACVGLVNATGVWVHSGGGITNSSINAVSETGLPNSEMYITNSNLTSSVPSVTHGGGWLQSAVDLVTVVAQLGLSTLVLFVNVILSIVAFSLTINAIFPWICAPDGGGALGVALVTAFQFGIWFLYMLTFVNIFAKPFPDSTAF